MTTENLEKGIQLHDRMKDLEEISHPNTVFSIHYRGELESGGGWKNTLQVSESFSHDDVQEVVNLIKEHFKKNLG